MFVVAQFSLISPPKIYIHSNLLIVFIKMKLRKLIHPHNLLKPVVRAQTLVSHSSVIHNVQVLHLLGKCITCTIYVP